MKSEQKLSFRAHLPGSGLWAALLAAFVLVFAGVLVACGDGTDDPADCNADQYYNEATGRCTVCPAIEEPQCQEGCGFSIDRDDRGCPVARCSATCDLCGEDEVFSEESLSCEAVDASNNSEEPDGSDEPDDSEDTEDPDESGE